MTAASSLICAIRGPILLIVLGALISLDYFAGWSFSRTWPVLFIVFGLLKLLENSGRRPGYPAYGAGYPPPGNYPPNPPGGPNL